MLSSLSDQEVLGLSPFVRLRREQAKITLSHLPHMTLRFGALSGEQAVIFSLIDGVRTVGEVIDAIMLLTDFGRDDARRYLLNLLAYITPDGGMLVRNATGKPVRRLNPEEYLIPASTIHLDTRLEAPLSVLFQITYTCQADCLYCYAQRRTIATHNRLSTARILSLLDELAELGVGQVNLCGGDPVCHPDFLEIVTRGIQHGFTLDISTKAHMSQSLCDGLADAGLDYMQVSIEADEATLGDQIYGRPGQFTRVTETLRHLLLTRIFTRTNSIITTLNLDRLEGIVTFLAGLGVREMKFSPAFRSMYRDNDALLLDALQIKQFEAIMTELAEQWRSRGVVLLYSTMPDPTRMTDEERQAYWFTNRPNCSSGRSSLVINPDGDVSLCEEAPQEGLFVVGNVQDKSIKEIWDSEQLLALAFPDRSRFADAPCASCPDFEPCVLRRGHCYKDAFKGYGRPFTVNPFCPIAPLPLPRLY